MIMLNIVDDQEVSDVPPKRQVKKKKFLVNRTSVLVLTRSLDSENSLALVEKYNNRRWYNI